MSSDYLDDEYDARLGRACVASGLGSVEIILALKPLLDAILKWDNCLNEFEGDESVCGEYRETLERKILEYRTVAAAKGGA